MRSMRRVMIGAGAGAAAVVLCALPAFAHVTVDPESVPQGTSDVTLTFRVPSEETNANTTQVDIQFPTDHPIAVVDPADANGWTAKVTTKHLATPITTDDGTITDVASEISWTGGTIAPGDFAEFKVLAQGIPTGVDVLKFPTVQTYSDGTVVSWIQDSTPGGAEPDNPTPELALTPAAGDGSSSSSPSGSSSSQAAAPAASPTVVKKETNSLGVVALVIAALALIASIAALARRPNRS